jgi:hypothetical protein
MHAGAGVEARPGQLRLAGRKGGARPSKKMNSFFFLFLKSKFNQTAPNSNFEVEKAFSKLDPKTKVVQNLILYNISFEHILKFQTDFEIEIQNPF